MRVFFQKSPLVRRCVCALSLSLLRRVVRRRVWGARGEREYDNPLYVRARGNCTYLHSSTKMRHTPLEACFEPLPPAGWVSFGMNIQAKGLTAKQTLGLGPGDIDSEALVGCFETLITSVRFDPHMDKVGIIVKIFGYPQIDSGSFLLHLERRVQAEAALAGVPKEVVSYLPRRSVWQEDATHRSVQVILWIPAFDKPLTTPQEPAKLEHHAKARSLWS